MCSWNVPPDEKCHPLRGTWRKDSEVSWRLGANLWFLIWTCAFRGCGATLGFEEVDYSEAPATKFSIVCTVLHSDALYIYEHTNWQQWFSWHYVTRPVAQPCCLGLFTPRISVGVALLLCRPSVLSPMSSMGKSNGFVHTQHWCCMTPKMLGNIAISWRWRLVWRGL